MLTRDSAGNGRGNDAWVDHERASLALWLAASQPATARAMIGAAAGGASAVLSAIVRRIGPKGPLGRAALSANPAVAVLRYLGAASCLTAAVAAMPSSALSQQGGVLAMAAQGVLANLARRANDGATALAALLVLNNCFPALCANLDIAAKDKRVIFGTIADLLASPQLAVHEANTNRELARLDVGSLYLATNVLVKACLLMPPALAADFLTSSGALRRVLALAEWSRSTGALFEACGDAKLLGELVVPGSQEALGSVVAELGGVVGLGGDHCAADSDSEPDDGAGGRALQPGEAAYRLCRVLQLQTVFLLSLALDSLVAVADPTKKTTITTAAAAAKTTTTTTMAMATAATAATTKPQQPQQPQPQQEQEQQQQQQQQLLLPPEQRLPQNKSNITLLHQIAVLLLGAVGDARDAFAALQRDKEAAAAERVRQLLERREREALLKLQAGGELSKSVEDRAEQRRREAAEEAQSAELTEHPDELRLRIVELCALRGLCELVFKDTLGAEWALKNRNGLLAIADLRAMSDEARRSNLDLFTALVRRAEPSGPALQMLIEMLEPVVVADLLVRFPEEANAAMLLSEVLRHRSEACEDVVVGNVLTLIEYRAALLEPADTRGHALITFMLDTVIRLCEQPASREALRRVALDGNASRLPGGTSKVGAVEALLVVLGKLLSLEERGAHQLDTTLHCVRALAALLRLGPGVTAPTECFVRARGPSLFLALVEEFAGSARAAADAVGQLGVALGVKARSYALLVEALKLVRQLCMVRSASLQRELLSAETLATMLAVCTAELETSANEQFRRLDAQGKRLAASILVALPFPREVGEPCIIAVVRRLLCLDYSQVPTVGCAQQAFAARMLSRCEFSEQGSALLRRSGVVATLLRHATEADAQLGPRARAEHRRANALLGLVYITADDANMQEHVCNVALYQLLKLAWQTEVSHEQHLLARLLEQLARNKNNRTRVYKAEIRARAVVQRWAQQSLRVALDNDHLVLHDDDEAEEQAEGKQSPSHHAVVLGADEMAARAELESVIRTRADYQRWLIDDLRVRHKKTVLPFQKNDAAVRAKELHKKLPRLPDGAVADASMVLTPRESPLWSFRDSILSPVNQTSSVARSNGKEPAMTSALLLGQSMCQPAKLLWTRPRQDHHQHQEHQRQDQHLHQHQQHQQHAHEDALHEAVEEPESQDKRAYRAAWRVPPKSGDPNRELSDLVPATATSHDLDVPPAEGHDPLAEMRAGETATARITQRTLAHAVQLWLPAKWREIFALPPLRTPCPSDAAAEAVAGLEQVANADGATSSPAAATALAQVLEDLQQRWTSIGEPLDRPLRLFVEVVASTSGNGGGGASGSGASVSTTTTNNNNNNNEEESSVAAAMFDDVQRLERRLEAEAESEPALEPAEGWLAARSRALHAHLVWRASTDNAAIAPLFRKFLEHHGLSATAKTVDDSSPLPLETLVSALAAANHKALAGAPTAADTALLLEAAASGRADLARARRLAQEDGRALTVALRTTLGGRPADWPRRLPPAALCEVGLADADASLAAALAEGVMRACEDLGDLPPAAAGKGVEELILRLAALVPLPAERVSEARSYLGGGGPQQPPLPDLASQRMSRRMRALPFEDRAIFAADAAPAASLTDRTRLLLHSLRRHLRPSVAIAKAAAEAAAAHAVASNNATSVPYTDEDAAREQQQLLLQKLLEDDEAEVLEQQLEPGPEELLER